MRESDLRNDSQQCAQKKDFAIDPFGPARLILAFVIYQFGAKEPTHWLESIQDFNFKLGVQTKILIKNKPSYLLQLTFSEKAT